MNIRDRQFNRQLAMFLIDYARHVVHLAVPDDMRFALNDRAATVAKRHSKRLAQITYLYNDAMLNPNIYPRDLMLLYRKVWEGRTGLLNDPVCWKVVNGKYDNEHVKWKDYSPF
jgi:hypothetical protein